MWNKMLTSLAVGSEQLVSNDGKEWKITSTSISAELLTGCAQRYNNSSRKSYDERGLSIGYLFFLHCK